MQTPPLPAPRISRRLFGVGALLTLGGLAGCSGGGTTVNVAPDPTSRVGAWHVALSPDGAALAARLDNKTGVWNTSTGTVAKRFDPAGPVAWSPDGLTLAVGGADARVRLLDASTGTVSRELVGHSEAQITDGNRGIATVAYAATGLLASAGADGDVIVWAPDGREQARLRGVAASAIAFSEDGSKLVATSTSANAKVFDSASGRLLRDLTESPAQGYGAAWSRTTLATTSTDPEGLVHLFDATTLTRTGTMPGGKHLSHAVAFDASGTKMAVAAARDKVVMVWSVGNSGVTTLAGHTDNPYSVLFSRDGSRLYSVSAREGIVVWNVATGARESTFALG